jgi:hypothetical protein
MNIRESEPAADLRRNLVEYFEMSLPRTVNFGSAGTFGWAVAVPEAAVRMPALRTNFLEVSTTRPTDVSSPLSFFFSFGNSIAPPRA